LESDRQRWDRKFTKRGVSEAPEPDQWLSHCPHLPVHGTALDVACGSGHNAVWLARRGLRVTAVDGSIEGLRLAQALARASGVHISAICADLDHYPLCGTFDLIIVMHYLNRPLLRSLPRLLARGGILAVKTFNGDFLERRPGFCGDYVLQPGELPELLPQLIILEHAESPPDDPGRSRLVGRLGP
jgi:tellurite methyltransferase